MSSKVEIGNVCFEPGDHYADNSVPRIMGVLNGQPNLNLWDSASLDRVAAHNPSVLAIDSLGWVQSLPQSVEGETKLTAEKAAYLWYSLPGTPREINGSDSILVVGGDNIDFFQKPALSTLGLYIVGAEAFAAIKVARAATQQASNYLDNVKDWYKNYHPVTGEWANPDERPTHTRRTVLRLWAGALVLGVASMNTWAPLLPSTQLTALDEKISDVDWPLVHPDSYLHPTAWQMTQGRTALVISKIVEAMRERQIEGNGVVLMGNAHTYRADQMISNEALRKELIREHFQTILQANKNPAEVKDYFGGSWTESERVALLKQDETQLSLFRVHQPNMRRFRSKPKSELLNIVECLGSFASSTVQEAIAGL